MCEPLRKESMRRPVARGWKRERLRSRLSRSSARPRDAQRALGDRDWRWPASCCASHFSREGDSVPHRSATAASDSGIHPRAISQCGRRGAQPRQIVCSRANAISSAIRTCRFALCAQIDWHFDPVHGRRAPRQFWASIPYLDPRFGDHKIIWELNRHQHWLMLGRAAWLTGDQRYAERFQPELASWLAEQSTAHRNQLVEHARTRVSDALVDLEPPFLRRPGSDDDESTDSTWLVDLLLGLDAQLNHICRHLSTLLQSEHSSARRRTGALCWQVACCRSLPLLRAGKHIGRQILRNEAHRQVTPDGGHAERLAALPSLRARLLPARADDRAPDRRSRRRPVCRRHVASGHVLPSASPATTAVSRRSATTTAGCCFQSAVARPPTSTDSLSLAAALLQRPELAVGDPPEETLWMLGGDRSRLRWPDRLERTANRISLPRRVTRCCGRARAMRSSMSVRHGFLNGGHAHADALSLVMSIEGRPFLVDPGTSTYTMDRRTPRSVPLDRHAQHGDGRWTPAINPRRLLFTGDRRPMRRCVCGVLGRSFDAIEGGTRRISARRAQARRPADHVGSLAHCRSLPRSRRPSTGRCGGISIPRGTWRTRIRRSGVRASFRRSRGAHRIDRTRLIARCGRHPRLASAGIRSVPARRDSRNHRSRHRAALGSHRHRAAHVSRQELSLETIEVAADGDRLDDTARRVPETMENGRFIAALFSTETSAAAEPDATIAAACRGWWKRDSTLTHELPCSGCLRCSSRHL